MRPPEPAHDEATELLRRLEREVAPMVENPEAIKILRPSALKRAIYRAALGAIALFVLAIAWQQLSIDARPIAETTTSSTAGDSVEISRLRSALADAEEIQQSLRAELDRARKDRKEKRK